MPSLPIVESNSIFTRYLNYLVSIYYLQIIMAPPGLDDGDETTPLIVTSSTDPAATKPQDNEVLHRQNDERVNDEDDTPLPKLQIALLCYARVVEPIAYFSIFPFINEMVQVVGNLDEGDVGFYTGVIVRTIMKEVNLVE